MKFTLSQTALVLGLACLAIHLWPAFKPASCGEWMKKFHRNTTIGVVLMLIATAWFEYNLTHSDISDFEQFRPILLGGFVVLGVGCCIFVRDYLSVRGLAAVTCLAADVVLDSQRWHPSPLRLPIAVWMYVLIVLAMWAAVAPWRARDWLNWCAAKEGRVRAAGMAGVVWGALVTALSFTAFR